MPLLCKDLFFSCSSIFFLVFPRKTWALNQEEVSGDMVKEELILLRHRSNEEDVVWALELKVLMTKILHGKRKKRYIVYCILIISLVILNKVIEIIINEMYNVSEFSCLPVDNMRWYNYNNFDHHK